MNNKDKISYAKDFFSGKDPEIDPMFVKPPKSLKRYSDNPDVYIDMKNENLTYTSEVVEEMKEKYFLIIVTIVTAPEDAETQRHYDNQKDTSEEVSAEHLPGADKKVSQIPGPSPEPATVLPAKPPKMYHIW